MLFGSSVADPLTKPARPTSCGSCARGRRPGSKQQLVWIMWEVMMSSGFRGANDCFLIFGGEGSVIGLPRITKGSAIDVCESFARHPQARPNIDISRLPGWSPPCGRSSSASPRRCKHIKHTVHKNLQTITTKGTTNKHIGSNLTEQNKSASPRRCTARSSTCACGTSWSASSRSSSPRRCSGEATCLTLLAF